MRLKPSEIFYTQDTIYERFSKGGFVKETWSDVKEGRVQITDFPALSVVKRYDKYWSLDNRRLWIFKKAEQHGICSTVEVYVNTNFSWNQRFTTTNGGEIYREEGTAVRGGVVDLWWMLPVNDLYK